MSLSHRGTGTATAVLLSMCFLAANPVPAQQVELWDESPLESSYRPTAEQVCQDPDHIAEPMFAFMVAMAESDSLGVWTARDIMAYADSLGRSSQFPLDLLREVRRQRPVPADRQAWPAAGVRAVWTLVLPEALERPLPYSILGYNPGSLRTSERMSLLEVFAGAAAGSSDTGHFAFTDIYLFRLEQGYMLLDVDGWLDRLLGKKLDDAATLGFVLGREGGRRVAVAVSVGRKGRRIYGEFDLCRDKVLPNGRPAASMLSAFARSLMMVGVAEPVARTWPAP